MVDALRVINEYRIAAPCQTLQQLHNFQTCQNLFRAGKTLVARSPVTEFPGRHKLTCFFHHIIKLEFHVRRVKRFEKQSISYRRIIHYSGNPRIHIVELALEDVAL